jgi:putative tricarboxylic transport membrane protein
MKSDRILAPSLFVLGSGYLVLTFLIPEPSGGYAAIGPRAFPVVVGIALVACSLWIGVSRRIGASQTNALAKDIPVRWRFFALSALTFLAYILLLEPIGYVLATVGVITLESRLLGSRSWARNLAVGCAITASIYGVFNLLLDIPLPRGVLG